MLATIAPVAMANVKTMPVDKPSSRKFSVTLVWAFKKAMPIMDCQRICEVLQELLCIRI